MASIEPIPEETNESVPQSIPENVELEPDNDKPPEPESGNRSIFQAVGIIIGKVNLTDDGKSTVTIGRNEYPLLYIPHKRIAFEGLKKEIAATGNQTQRLVVYPKVTHFPRKEQPHQIAFQLVGFDLGRQPEAVSGELKDLEFKFSGLWQFIPVCQTPCISIFRNFTRERLEYIKQAEPARKVKFMKASHLPLLWKDAPVRPFRFNPKAGKDQGHPAFVEIKAKFLPQRDVFGFIELLSEPSEHPPRFLKASKKDKAEVQQASKKSPPPPPPPEAPVKEKPALQPIAKKPRVEVRLPKTKSNS